MTLDYNRLHGRRRSRPPRQIKNWIPRIVLIQAVVVALLTVSGFAKGGFLRIPGMPSKGATAGSPNAVESRGMAIAWATMVGSFHISTRAPQSTPVAAESGNRYRRATPAASSSIPDGGHWTSGSSTLDYATLLNRSGTGQFFRALAGILSTHNKSALAAGIGGSNTGTRSGVGGGHANGTGAGLAAAGAGTKIASAATQSGGTTGSSGAGTAAIATATSASSANASTTAIATSAPASVPVAASGASMAAPAVPLDAQRVWANTGTDFNDGGSWVGGIAPGAGDVAAFDAAVVTQPNLSTSLSISGLYFSGAGTSGYNIPNTSTETFTLTAFGTTIGAETGDPDAVAIGAENTSGTNTVAVPIDLAPSSGSTSTIFQEAGGTLVLSGVISG